MITVTGLVEPMSIKRENRRILFNEFFVLLFSYCLLLLTDFVSDL